MRASLGQSPTESARDCSERSVCTVKGCLVPSTSGRRGRKHAHETARARFAVVSGHVWKLRRSEKSGIASIVAQRGYCRFARHSCYAGLQAVCQNVLARLGKHQWYCHFDHSATLVLCGIVGGCCKAHFSGREEKNRAVQATEQVTGSWEAVQSRSSTNKRLPREEVAERRGASAKRSL